MEKACMLGETAGSGGGGGREGWGRHTEGHHQNTRAWKVEERGASSPKVQLRLPHLPLEPACK